MRRKHGLKEAFLTGSSILLASLGVFFLKTSPADSATQTKQILLSAELSHPFLLSGSKQTAYIKVDLEGFELDPGKKRAPINVALVIDKSGSMSGDRIIQAKRAATLAVERFLQAQDIVSIVAYDDEPTVLVPATKASNKTSILRAIEQIQVGSGTGLFAGVKSGAQELEKFLSKNQVNRIILLSDGQANVGPSSPSELGELGAALAKKGISVTTIGIGLGYNEDLMTQLALKSDGNHAFAKDPDQLATIFTHEFGDVLSVVAQDVRIIIECQQGVKPIRVLGREVDIFGQKVVASLQQLYSKQDKYILLEVEIEPSFTNLNQPLALVNTSYNNMLSQNRENLSAKILAQGFTQDKSVSEQRVNKKVMAAASEQIGAENTNQAVKLLDAGDVTGAARLLQVNAANLDKDAEMYNAPELKKSAATNRAAADQAASAPSTSRKAIREYQHNKAVQQAPY